MRTVRSALFCALAAVVLASCFTGERPKLLDAPPGGEIGQPSGDANADAVLTLLEATSLSGFTARYDLTLRLGSVVNAATVTFDGATRRSVTIGDVRFLQVGGQQTCQVSTATCEEGIIEARTSDTGFTSTFDRTTPSRRLRLAVSRRTGPTTLTTETIAGLPASCVGVPLGAGVETYCALQVGGLARWESADLQAVLSSYEGVATEALFGIG